MDFYTCQRSNGAFLSGPLIGIDLVDYIGIGVFRLSHRMTATHCHVTNWESAKERRFHFLLVPFFFLDICSPSAQPFAPAEVSNVGGWGGEEDCFRCGGSLPGEDTSIIKVMW